MQGIQETVHPFSSSALTRILGEEPRIAMRETVSVNRFVQLESSRLEPAESEFPEDQGRLFLFPIGEGQYNLQLCYLQAEGNFASFHWVDFLPGFFELYTVEMLSGNTPFRFDQTTEHSFNICSQTRILLEQMQQAAGVSELLQSLHLTELSIQLLRRAIENITIPFTVCPVPACRFLAYESEREKIVLAQSILEQHADQPMSIKELSRKVAMNECYLKKGFKTITGKTINEYQQNLRIMRAKELLQQQGQTVSDVASVLGYSSISHFSTAFKKATGLKPCELLG